MTRSSDAELRAWAEDLSPLDPRWRLAHRRLALASGEVYLPSTGPTFPLLTLWSQWARSDDAELRRLGAHALDTVANYPAVAQAKPPVASSTTNRQPGA